MKKIYKYRLDFDGYGVETPIMVPPGSNIIAMGSDGPGSMCFWAEIPVGEESLRPLETRYFMVIPTGFMEIPAGYDHFHTYITAGRVHHVYLKRNKKLPV